MTPKEIAKRCNVKLWKVYYIANILGRLPSESEVINWKQKRGRKPKWEQKGE